MAIVEPQIKNEIKMILLQHKQDIVDILKISIFESKTIYNMCTMN